MDFLVPLVHLKIISNDQQSLYYPKERLIRSCKMLKDMDDEAGDFEEISLDFPAKAIQAFLTFLETQEASEEQILEFAQVADYLDLNYLNPLLKEKDAILDFISQGQLDNYSVCSFLLQNGVSNEDWAGLSYFLTHRDITGK